MSAAAPVLLVEDDPDEIAVALRALHRAGIDVEVEVASDGLEALEALGIEPAADPRSRSPRVVFLDLKMPRIDGWEVLRRIREHPPTADVPVVVLSSSDRAEDVARSYRLGANSFVQKRFDPNGPGRYFAQAVRYWLELNRIPSRRTPA
jgi:two-component system response regulator